MGKVIFSPVEEEIIDSIAEEFGIPRIQAVEHFIEHKRSIMREAVARKDWAVADAIRKQLGE